MAPARPHQVEAAQRIIAAFRAGRRHILVAMPMGTGRTVVAQLVTETLLSMGQTVTIVGQLRAEIEQVKHRIKGGFGTDVRSGLQFATTAQLTDARRPGSFDLSDRVVIGINASFATALTEHTRTGQALDAARAVIGFTSLPSVREHSFYGDPVYVLGVPDAIDQGILPPIAYLSIGNLTLRARSTEADIQRAIDEVLPRLDGGKVVFVCSHLAVLHAVYARLSSIAPPGVRVSRMARDDAAQHIDLARDGDWIVTSSLMLAGWHIQGVRNVVLLSQLHDAESLLRAAQSVFGSPAGRILDLGDNVALWHAFGMEASHASPVDANVADGAGDADWESEAVQKWIRPRADGAAATDLMDRERLIHVLRGIIKSKSEERSLAIGIFGRWGSGKSTIINLLKQRFKDNKEIVFIEFNAWENEHVSSMPAALADAVTQQIYAQRKGIGRWWLLLKHRAMINDVLLSAAIVLFLGLLLTLAPLPKLDDKLQFGTLTLIAPPLRNAVIVVLTAFFALQLAWKSPVTQGVRSVLKQIGYTEHIGLARRLRDDLTKLFLVSRARLRDRLPQKLKTRFGIESARASTYVVVIDDLDRCSRANVWNVVEATRLIAEFKDVVLVFAVDYRLLFDAIAERLHDKVSGTNERQRLSREFLAKILQLSVQLPEPSKAVVAHYIAQALFEGLEDKAGRGDAVAKVPAPDADITQEPDELSAVGPVPEEDDPTLEQADEYILSTPAQRTIFQECAAVFEMGNPRTLLRLYNSLTLIKGMHLEVGDEEQEYRRHAFYVFLTELCAAENKVIGELKELLSETASDANTELWRSIRDYAERHGLHAESQQRLNRTAAQRANSTSLPVM